MSINITGLDIKYIYKTNMQHVYCIINLLLWYLP